MTGPGHGSPARVRAVVSWSSGKDAAFALDAARRSGRFEIAGLITTVTQEFGRVSMHGVRRELLRLQASSLGLPLTEVEIPYPCPNSIYEERMGRALERLCAQQIRAVVFGDLYLEGIRRYREARMAGSGLLPVFPLWGRPTRALANEMIASGLVARIVCLDPTRVPRELAGARFDERLLGALPETVDPCGENGEFHTCVTDGPGFRSPIRVRSGEVVDRDGFVFADLVPDPGPAGEPIVPPAGGPA